MCKPVRWRNARGGQKRSERQTDKCVVPDWRCHWRKQQSALEGNRQRVESCRVIDMSVSMDLKRFHRSTSISFLLTDYQEECTRATCQTTMIRFSLTERNDISVRISHGQRKDRSECCKLWTYRNVWIEELVVRLGADLNGEVIRRW